MKILHITYRFTNVSTHVPKTEFVRINPLQASVSTMYRKEDALHSRFSPLQFVVEFDCGD